MSAQPRTIATAARTTVLVGSGLALGVMSAHFYADAAVTADAKQAAAITAARQAKPKVVTVWKTKHVKSDPIIVYRKVPAAGGGTYTPTDTGSSYSGGTGSSGGSAPAPAPAAPKPAAPAAPSSANSGAS